MRPSSSILLPVLAAAAMLLVRPAARAEAGDGGSVDRPIAEGLSAWREPTGAWQLAGDVFLDPAGASRLAASPGKRVLFNGPQGRTDNLLTREEYGDAAVHVDFLVPEGSNSGVYLMGRYEIQVFDSWDAAAGKPKENPTYSDCGGIYERWDASRGAGSEGYEGHPPRVNAARRPGEWQTFDIVFRAPRFDGSGKKTENARFVSVVQNGVLIHEDVDLTGPTRAAAWESAADEKPAGPLMLQGDHGPVAYKNLTIRRLGEGAAEAGGEAARADGFPREKLDDSGFETIFDGTSLAGWHASAKTGHSSASGHRTGGRWVLEDGAIVGSQDIPGNGGIFITDRQWSDFEVILEMKNDFGPDSGLFLRSTEDGRCYQYLVDYHNDGNLAGLYGEGLNPGFHIRNFSFTDSPEKIVEMKCDFPLPVKPADWPRFWRHGRWNTLRARITGNPPRIITWINGVRFMDWTDDQKRLGDSGGIAVQVHGGGDGTKQFVRYRNVRVKDLTKGR